MAPRNVAYGSAQNSFWRGNLTNLFNRHLAFAIGAALFFIAVPLSATPTQVSLFNQCQPTGQVLGCTYLLEFGTNGSTSLLYNPNAKDVDGQEDILVGNWNNTGHYLDLTPYNGPNDPFPGLHLTGGLGTTITSISK